MTDERMLRLFVNIDHVATVRQARRADEPDPVRAAVLVELAGADGITVHLRADRRHIQDRDVHLLAETLRTPMNLEISVDSEIVEIGLELLPQQITIVPEKREEVTTEGGLDLSNPAAHGRLTEVISAFNAGGSRTALFIDPVADAVRISRELGATAVELHTGEYADAASKVEREIELERLASAARLAVELGLNVHAGHGLTYLNVVPVAQIPEIEELNIGHSMMARAMFVGLDAAVRDMRDLFREAGR